MKEVRLDRDTVAIEESVHDLYRQLTEGNDPKAVPFRTMKDLFLWAASLGFQQGQRRPLGGPRKVIFRWTQFSPQDDIPVLKALAIATTHDLGVLLSQEEVLTIAEEYANAGILDLRESLLEVGGPALWNLVQLVTAEQAAG